MPAQRPSQAQYRVVNPVLQNLLIAYANPPENFIGARMLEPIPTEDEQTGTIFSINRGDLHGDPSDALEWGLMARAHQSAGFGTGTATYTCERFGDEAGIPRLAKNRNQIPTDLKATHLEVITQNLVIAQERRIAAAVFNATTFTQGATLAGADQWMNAAGAAIATGDPIGAIFTGINTVEAATGRTPNAIVFGRVSWLAFLQHPAVLDFLSQTKDRQLLSGDEARTLLLQRFDGFKKVFVGKARRRTSNVNQALVLADVWTDSVWIGNIEAQGRNIGEGNGNMSVVPTAVARFVEYDFRLDEYYDDPTDADYVRVSHSEDVVATSAADGYYLQDVQAA